MSYKNNFHEVELTRVELEDALKASVLAAHSPEDAPKPKSYNQMTVEYRDEAGNIIRPYWVKVRWVIE